MTTITITLPETISATSRDRTVSLATAMLTADIVAKLAVHGAVQKISDAAASAMKLAADELGKDAAIEALKARASELAEPMMQKAADALARGEWSSRVAGEGVGEETRVARQIMRTLLKAKFGAKSREWATFTGLADAEQNAKLDALVEKNKDAIAEKVKEELARRAAMRKAQEGLVKKVTFDI